MWQYTLIFVFVHVTGVAHLWQCAYFFKEFDLVLDRTDKVHLSVHDIPSTLYNGVLVNFCLNQEWMHLMLYIVVYRNPLATID